MDCRNIREQFSPYLDNVLSPRERMDVDGHLRSCKECFEALAELKQTIERIKSLEEIEPPAWLEQKVMARVRAEAEFRKGLFQKLFYPLSVKLPVGAIAAIAIALTTLYIFRTVEPEIKLAKAPREETVPQVPTREKEQQPARRDSETDKVAPSSPPLPAPAVPPGNTGTEDRAVPKAPEPTKQVEVPQELTSPALLKKKDAAMSSTGAPAMEEIKQEAAPPAPASRGRAEEKSAYHRVIVRVDNVDVALGQVEKHISELGGRVLKKESYEDKDILDVEIDPEKLKEFLERLKSVGEVKEKKIDFDGAKGRGGIRLEIVKTPFP